MQLSQKSAISAATTAAIVVVALVVVVAGAYVATQTPATRTSTINTSSVVTTTATQSVTSATYSPLTLQAGGSTFVNPVMLAWIAGFNGYTNGAVNTNYQALGSGAGITGVLKGTFDFAGSDVPVPASTLANYTASKGPLLTIPETLGAVAVFYNVPGESKILNLTGPIIAQIYLQHITMWNDPAILAINPGANSTALNNAIIPIHRSDGSGTTGALTNYFTKVSSDWNSSGIGQGTSVSWPNSPNPELAGKGSAGVANLVASNHYSIGYADSYYAFSNNLASAKIKNQAGVFLAPSLAGISAAASHFSTRLQTNPAVSITDAPGADSYAISTFTYLLVWQNQTNQAKGNDIAQMFEWIVTHGQTLGQQYGYPALPSNVVTIDQNLIAQMNYNGAHFITT